MKMLNDVNERNYHIFSLFLGENMLLENLFQSETLHIVKYQI